MTVCWCKLQNTVTKADVKYNKLTANILLTNVGVSLRKQTTVCRISSWDILIPFATSSCSERAKNMQLPSPWLSEITKPFSWAVLFKFSDSSVWLVSLRAYNWICRSVWNVKSPVNNKVQNYSLWRGVVLTNTRGCHSGLKPPYHLSDPTTISWTIITFQLLWCKVKIRVKWCCSCTKTDSKNEATLP